MPDFFLALLILFRLYMIFDCVRRRAAIAWMVIILILPNALGGLLYLVIRKMSDAPGGRQRLGPLFASGGLLNLGSPPASAPGSREGTDSEPALAVADRLEEQGRFGEAALIYRRSLGRHPGRPRALHGLGRCLIEIGEDSEALESYEALMEIEPRFRDYAAALEYAEALHRVGRNADAIGLLEGLVKETDRLNHHLALAHYLEQAGETVRAREILNEALKSYENSPPPEQIANRRWHRQILDKLEDTSLAGSNPGGGEG